MPSSAPRIYALDMVFPECGSETDDLQVVDVNGARSSCYLQSLLYGDDRVQETIIRMLAEAGGGVITSVSQSILSPIQTQFDAESLSQRFKESCGWYNASSAYVPLGDPTSNDSEEYTIEMARRLGIEYHKVLISWETEENCFMVYGNGASPMRFKDWEPQGLLWPYSWDQRSMPLPGGSVVCNPPQYAAPTTNKYLAYHLSGQLPEANFTPKTVLGGFWLPDSERLLSALSSFSASPLAIIKPLAGRRGFGVLVSPTEYLRQLLPELGLVAEPENILAGAEALMFALLWGEAHELLPVVQAYAQPRLINNPTTKRPHTSLIRATVIVEPGEAGDTVRCIDACQVLLKEPRDGPMHRDALILSVSSTGDVLELNECELEHVHRTAERYIASLENGVRTHFTSLTPADLLESEADLLVSALDQTSDAPVQDLWRQYRGSAYLCDVLSELVNK